MRKYELKTKVPFEMNELFGMPGFFALIFYQGFPLPHFCQTITKLKQYRN